LPVTYSEEISSLTLSPFAKYIGIKFESVARNYCCLKLLLDEKCINYTGGIHGGVIATLADTCMGFVLRASGLQPLTAELTVNYLAAPQVGDELIAEGWVIHRGKTIILTECKIKTTSNVDVATGRGIFVNRSRPRERKE